jgi:hypothetical protein
MPDAKTTLLTMAHDARREANEPLHEIDKLRTFREAAEMTGLKYHVIQRAAKHGLLKTYSLGTSKKYVTLRDILDAASKTN